MAYLCLALHTFAMPSLPRSLRSPKHRFLARRRFYEAANLAEYFRFEAAFLRWEIQRGVFDEKNGSPWWKKVNERLIFNSEQALALWQKNSPPRFCTKSVALWLTFLHEPNPKHWYRAHNASILEGYAEAQTFLQSERKYEHTFILSVKYRLLFAQKIIENGSSPFVCLADPRGRTLEFLMPLSFLYPPHYPNTVTFGQKQWTRFKNLLTLPSLEELEKEAAQWGG